jgi:hypothetical protein
VFCTVAALLLKHPEVLTINEELLLNPQRPGYGEQLLWNRDREGGHP